MASPLRKVDNFRYRIDRDFQTGMRVPGIIYSDDSLLENIIFDNAFKQVANVATLPGIVSASLAMPDIHWGYGFPIGGVAAMELDGVVSPGGVGYDINCGVRLFLSNLNASDLKGRIQVLVDKLFEAVPCGVGSSGKIKVSGAELDKVLTQGAKWAVSNGLGWPEDLERTEDFGCLSSADPACLSPTARKRGLDQVGTLGSGNHFLEVQVVDKVFETEIARVFGLRQGQVCCMIHSGSRGLGHQVCEDNARALVPRMRDFGITAQDQQLAGAAISSKEGRSYLSAMACAANYAWANRQAIMHYCRHAFAEVFQSSPEKLELRLLYDVAHNIAKFEDHAVEGKNKRVLVHRKGATRAFGPGRPEITPIYRSFGQPVIIPGDMGTASFVLAGTEGAMRESFGSTCHGAGRRLSRSAAIKATKGRRIGEELAKKGIFARWRGRETMSEEAPEAYKDIDTIVKIVEGAGLSRVVARLVPVAVIKG